MRLPKMKQSIFTENRKYTFSDYFNMSATAKEIAAELGYSFFTTRIQLPQYADYDKTIIENLNNLYDNIFLKVNLNSEFSKREFLISPLLIELAQLMDITIDTENAIFVNDKLSGNFAYLLKAKQSLIVIEAKNKDMEAGFKQLVAELIALDKYEETAQARFLYGAITLGDFWKFAVLDRPKKQLIKDINAYTVPHNTDEVFSILMGILTGQ
jgi:hypothetical protein